MSPRQTINANMKIVNKVKDIGNKLDARGDRAPAIIAYMLIMFLISALFINFLNSNLFPWCHEVYPKIAFGISLYYQEAQVIYIIGIIGLILLYARIHKLLFKTGTAESTVYYIIFLFFVLFFELMSNLGCF